MRAAVWVVDPDMDETGRDALLAWVGARDLKGELRETPDGTVLLVRDVPPGLEPPDGILRTAGVEVPRGEGISRRAFLDAFAMALTAATAGAGVTMASLFVAPPARRGQDEDEVEVGGVDELEKAGFLTFRLGREPAVVIHSGGEYYALSLVCTHLGCLVEWNPKRRQLLCPCHKAAFDIGGNVLAGPPPRPLPSFVVAEREGRIWVRRRTAS